MDALNLSTSLLPTLTNFLNNCFIISFNKAFEHDALHDVGCGSICGENEEDLALMIALIY